MEHPHDTGNKASDAKSVSKTLAILSTFDERTPMQRTSDIAARLGDEHQYRVQTFEYTSGLGFLRRDDETGWLLSWKHRSYPLQCSSAGQRCVPLFISGITASFIPLWRTQPYECSG